MGCIGCIGALGVLIWESKLTSSENIWIFVMMVVTAFVIEIVYRKIANRRHKCYF